MKHLIIPSVRSLQYVLALRRMTKAAQASAHYATSHQFLARHNFCKSRESILFLLLHKLLN